MSLILLRQCSAAALLAAFCYAAHPTPKDATDAYQYAEALRSKARPLWQSKNAEGVKLLEEALDYFDQPLVRDLAKGSLSLKTRPINIHVELATAHALMGSKEGMYRSVEWLLKNVSGDSARGLLSQGAAFEPFRNEERFQQALRSSKRAPFWETDALKTKYSENISDAEKVAGLSKFWSEAKYNFVYVEKLRRLDWDKQYFEYIPKVLATKSTAEYYKVLQRLCAMLQDGHTNVMPPPESAGLPIPIRAALVEGKVFIKEVPSASLRESGITAGMEIVSIDGSSAVEYGRNEIMPYINSSTPQDLDQRSYGFELLSGPKGTSVKLRLRDASGAVTEKLVERRVYKDIEMSPAFSWKMLPGNIAYVSLRTFGSNRTANEFEAAFDELSKAEGIIFDVRSNGGGSSDVGWRILSMLTDKPFPTGRYRYRSYVPTERAWGRELDWLEDSGLQVEPHGKKLYSNPVAVLSGPATYSAAEDFLIGFESLRRGKIIGEPSGGSTGQPLLFSLPGGGSARVCTKQDMYPDGREWVGKGIQPDILVKPTVEDMRAGRDAVLEAARDYLKRQQAVK